MKNFLFNRRAFFKTCLSTATLVAANPNLLAQSGRLTKEYAPALLKLENGDPLTSETFNHNKHFIFHYPYATTPCFLIKLDQPVAGSQQLETVDDDSYQWSGGVGPDKSVVAFSAICAHKLSYPTRTTSFINYRPEQISYVNNASTTVRQSQLIYCCSERSVYDPAQGAKVLGGPAPQPLTAIIIKHDPDSDHYYATATLGGELYNRFFDSFSFRIALENKTDDIRQFTRDSTTAYSPEHYTNYQARC